MQFREAKAAKGHFVLKFIHFHRATSAIVGHSDKQIRELIVYQGRKVYLFPPNQNFAAEAKGSLDEAEDHLAERNDVMDVTKADHCPSNYSWISKDLAAMAYPSTKENIQYLLHEGIKCVVTLSPEAVPQISEPQLHFNLIPIEDLEPPTLQDILSFIEICKSSKEKNEPIVVHCRTGRGRTGVMAACYLMYFNQWRPEKSILNLRLLRPGSIETAEQERIVFKFYDYLMTL